MKKLLLSAVIAIFAMSNVNAQEVKFGAKAGVNFASLSGDDADGLDGRTSFHVGALAEIGISEKFAVQPELLYSSQGASFEDNNLKMDYINLPILAKFLVAEGFSIEVGPQVGFLISADAEGEDVKDAFKSTDFSGALGLGYKLESGLNFAARYNLGLGNIADGDGDIKNNVIQLSVGYFF
ncbi:porin family protein [Confluentibacter lentus]|uniref:porin family protein n=1 Tax=Confluentibacter lentus TaxID=1699412 RepID=UPI000C2883A3|nr:porin family protein [Confluentibacter lentus]